VNEFYKKTVGQGCEDFKLVIRIRIETTESMERQESQEDKFTQLMVIRSS